MPGMTDGAGRINRSTAATYKQYHASTTYVAAVCTSTLNSTTVVFHRAAVVLIAVCIDA